MLRDITLGQYYQTESLIHKMDPRVKLGGTVLFIISLFFFKNYAGYVIAALFLGLVIRLSKVPFKFMVKGMKTIVMLMLITVVFNLFLTPGTPLFTIWKLTITQEGLKMAISMAIRLTLLIIGSSVMTLPSPPLFPVGFSIAQCIDQLFSCQYAIRQRNSAFLQFIR